MILWRLCARGVNWLLKQQVEDGYAITQHFFPSWPVVLVSVTMDTPIRMVYVTLLSLSMFVEFGQFVALCDMD